jgi:hypothetical protein
MQICGTSSTEQPFGALGMVANHPGFAGILPGFLAFPESHPVS